MCSGSAPGCRQMPGEGAVRRFSSKAHSSSKLKHGYTQHKIMHKQALAKSEVPKQYMYIISKIPVAVTQTMCAGASLSTAVFLENQIIISHM